MPTTVTVLGSSDAFNSAGRGNACYLVRDAEGAFCVDFGPTALCALKAARFEPSELDAVLLTHLHGDHFAGLSQLFIDAQFRAPRNRPLIVAGPKGTRRTVQALHALCFGRSAKAAPLAVRYVEWRPHSVVHVAGRRLETFPARHMRPSDGALMYRVKTGRATLAFTGDTGWTADLVALAEGTGLLVAECTEWSGEAGKHLTWEVLQARLPQLKARRILLSHLSGEARRKLARGLPRKVLLADDGMSLRV